MKMKVEEGKFYVSNKKLYEVYCEHLKEISAAEEAGLPKPKMHPFIAEAVLRIARKYANRPNFIGYSYRDEMIADAIEICCRNYAKFNPEKSNNPFSYLTQFCHNAFLQRINKEKRQTSIKSRYIANAVDHDLLTSQAHEDEEFHNNFVEFLRENNVFEDSIAAKKERDAKKKEVEQKEKGPSLEDFFDEKDDE